MSTDKLVAQIIRISITVSDITPTRDTQSRKQHTNSRPITTSKSNQGSLHILNSDSLTSAPSAYSIHSKTSSSELDVKVPVDGGITGMGVKKNRKLKVNLELQNSSLDTICQSPVKERVGGRVLNGGSGRMVESLDGIN
ncbi:hypothetical protein HK098_002513 [Nowakowskiella sp. JEL0407]|nr:hypothetical protein HK098_002513 [Nowakowskiella sp. JEL0407]